MRSIAAIPFNLFIVMFHLMITHLMITTISCNALTPTSTTMLGLGLGDKNYHESEFEIYNNIEEKEVGFGLIRGSGRILATSHKKMTCKKYPKVCRVAGSPGRDCCKKKCVNVNKDRANCGKCGKKCKYSDVCCKGKCVIVLRDKKNCGGCGKKCSKGERCRYGMCSYA